MRGTSASRERAVARDIAGSKVKPVPNDTAAARSSPPSGYSGSLSVSSSPGGANVFVNGALAGVTPLVLPNVVAGSRAVRVELPGHDRWSSSVRIVAGEETRVTAKLRPSSKR